MRKSTKCPHKIIAHSSVKYMAAMAWPHARPNVLHPRQYGGINLERAYSDEIYTKVSYVYMEIDQRQSSDRIIGSLTWIEYFWLQTRYFSSRNACEQARFIRLCILLYI